MPSHYTDFIPARSPKLFLQSLGKMHIRSISSMWPVLALFLLFFAVRAQAESDCHDVLTQAETNDCSVNAASASDKALDAVYRKLAGILQGDERKELVEAQRAWVAAREKECTFESDLYSGGSMGPTVYAECVKRMSDQRSADFNLIIKQNS